MRCTQREAERVKAWLALNAALEDFVEFAVLSTRRSIVRFIDCRPTEQSMRINVQLQCVLSSGKAGAFNISFVWRKNRRSWEALRLFLRSRTRPCCGFPPSL